MRNNQFVRALYFACDCLLASLFAAILWAFNLHLLAHIVFAAGTIYLVSKTWQRHLSLERFLIQKLFDGYVVVKNANAKLLLIAVYIVAIVLLRANPYGVLFCVGNLLATAISYGIFLDLKKSVKSEADVNRLSRLLAIGVKTEQLHATFERIPYFPALFEAQNIILEFRNAAGKDILAGSGTSHTAAVLANAPDIAEIPEIHHLYDEIRSMLEKIG